MKHRNPEAGDSATTEISRVSAAADESTTTCLGCKAISLPSLANLHELDPVV